jgi:hypothetical protein
MAVTEEQAESDLRPFLPRMARAVRAALAEYVTDYVALRHKHSKRTRASVLHDLMVKQLDKEFPVDPNKPVPDVMVMPRGNLNLLVVFLGKYKIRIKKFGSRLRTSNIPTQACLDFERQESFAAIPDATNLNLGYQPLDDATLLTSRVWLTCPNGSGVHWYKELPLTMAESERPVDLNAHRPAAVKPPKKRRAALKQENKSEKKKRKAKGSSDDEQGGKN